MIKRKIKRAIRRIRNAQVGEVLFCKAKNDVIENRIIKALLNMSKVTYMTVIASKGVLEYVKEA